MKLIIQIPCYNEEASLGQTLAAIPKQIKGIDCIEILLIDDGSNDQSVKIATEYGVHHIIRFSKNRGLAHAFRAGIDAAIKASADIIVNLDGDNQYSGSDIEKLITPILTMNADIVIGNRNPEMDTRNSIVKRFLYRVGRYFVSRICATDVPDPSSGFRALSRHAALEINIFSSFSYTLEMILQAEYKRLTIRYVEIATNAVTRPSRLFNSSLSFIYYSSRTILETYLLYRPFKLLFCMGILPFALGVPAIFRFLWIFVKEGTAGHTQSLVLGSFLILVAIALWMVGILGHLIARNRLMLEKLLMLKRNEH